MMSSDGFTRLIDTWLREEGVPTRPTYLDDVLTRTSTIRQRPAWLSPGRWLPMDTTLARRAPRVPPILLYAILAAILILGAVAALAIVGSQQPKLPPPFGVAVNGPIAVEVDGSLALFQADGTRTDVKATRALQASPTFSRDGSRMAYWAADDAADRVLIVADGDGKDERVVARGFGLGIDLDPGAAIAWSPDGSQIAFSAWKGGRSVLVVADVEGSDARVIGEGWAPVWSTDGAWLAFGEMPAGATVSTSVLVARPDGSDRRTLATAYVPPGTPTGDERVSVQDIGWAPDGSGRILYSTGSDAAGRVMVVDATTGTQTVVFDSPFVGVYSPTWSPDAKRIATSWFNAGYVVMDADGSDVREVLEGRCSGPITWSPDGTRIVCLDSVALGEGRSELLLTDPDGTAPLRRFPLGGSTSQQSNTTFGWQRLAP